MRFGEMFYLFLGWIALVFIIVYGNIHWKCKFKGKEFSGTWPLRSKLWQEPLYFVNIARARQGSIYVNIQDIFTCMVIQTHPIVTSLKMQQEYWRCAKIKHNKVMSIKLQKCLRCWKVQLSGTVDKVKHDII